MDLCAPAPFAVRRSFFSSLPASQRRHRASSCEEGPRLFGLDPNWVSTVFFCKMSYASRQAADDGRLIYVGNLSDDVRERCVVSQILRGARQIRTFASFASTFFANPRPVDRTVALPAHASISSRYGAGRGREWRERAQPRKSHSLLEPSTHVIPAVTLASTSRSSAGSWAWRSRCRRGRQTLPLSSTETTEMLRMPCATGTAGTSWERGCAWRWPADGPSGGTGSMTGADAGRRRGPRG